MLVFAAAENGVGAVVGGASGSVVAAWTISGWKETPSTMPSALPPAIFGTSSDTTTALANVHPSSAAPPFGSTRAIEPFVRARPCSNDALTHCKNSRAMFAPTSSRHGGTTGVATCFRTTRSDPTRSVTTWPSTKQCSAPRRAERRRSGSSRRRARAASRGR